jgi:tetratricopeptide (TPR) repeat protein
MAPKRIFKKQIKEKKERVGFQEQPKQKPTLFPKIYRFITERWKLVVASLVSGLIIIAIILQGISLYHNIQEEKRIEEERGKTSRELKFWKDSLTQYPQFRDIYLRIASLEYRLGNKEAARENVRKALEIDPNSKEAREMEKQFE